MTTDEEHAFWDEIILNDDGTVNLDAVYRELHDYHFVMEQARRVYYDITCGLMSKPNYYAADVISQADQCVTNQIREEVLDVLKNIQAGEVTVEEAIDEWNQVT